MRRRLRRTFEVFALVLAAGLLPYIPAGAQEAETTLAFYALSAKASPIFQTYNQPSFPIPATPTQELSLGHSEVSLENGSAHGVASVLWPGSTAANFPSALRDLGYPADLPAPPNYPVRAESFFPTSEGQEDSALLDAGGVVMRSSSSATSCTASARSAEVEGVLETGGASSRSSNRVEGAAAVASAQASVSDIRLAGVIAIEQVTSFAEATSDGTTAKLAGRTVVTGVTVQGVEVTVDRDGVHADGNDAPIPIAGVTDPMNEQLAAAGIAMFVAEPLDNVDGPTATRSLGGLIITFQPKVLAQNLPPGVLSGLPPEVPGFLTTFDQTITIALAGIAVRASASPPFVAPPPPPPPPPIDGGGGGVPPAPSVAPPAVEPTTRPQPSPVSGSEPPSGASLPVAVAVAGLVLAAVGSRGLRVVADRALFGAPATAACPLEES
ncbi:MAG: hypothetical protein WD770_09325 [Actinomycetota bacterium]